MPSLTVIIIVLALAGCMMMVGTALTVRRSRVAQQEYVGGSKFVPIAPCSSKAQCSFCGGMTVHYVGVMFDGQTYSPICLDCQYRSGIRCQDGSINQEFAYQVEQYC